MEEFNNKNLLEMTDEERKYDGWASEMNINFLERLIKEHKALEFKQNAEKFIIISPSVKKEGKKRITFFDKKGPISHRIDNDWKLAQKLYSELGFRIKEPSSVIN